MVTVEFLGPIGLEDMHVEASTLGDVARILQNDERVSAWLATSAVAVNDELTSNLSKPLKNGDKVSLLPPVCGG
ncbi:MAG: molybdenum cofactor biosynthesis protein MoaD [Sulfuricurvum sp. PC08-66]|nr:MAG: molybdenum cofactor biosynthesis protein MoaD [Sulfuricurvum sp. PC08-66]